ncbi:MAG: hypothetical protein P4L40_14615, partial [Terracidiphilus sp.]|nr:hypothetical protein [Terracidiphilus sp.]
MPCSTRKRHALAVDIAHLQRNNLTDPQSRAVGDGQCRVVLQVGGRSDQTRHLLATQHHRQLLGYTHVAHLGHQFAAVERDVEEELQPGDGGIERDRRDAPIDQVQLEAPKIFHGGCVGRTLEKAGEVPNRANVGSLGLGSELAHAHVIEHALAQRRDR